MKDMNGGIVVMGTEMAARPDMAPDDHAMAPMPSMNEALREWIDQRIDPRAGTLVQQELARVSDDEKVERLSKEYAYLDQAGTAFSVLQGFVLAQAAALGEKSFRRVIAENDVSRAAAFRNRDLYRLFNELGDLKLVAKAEALGPARIRELKPYFGIDGIRKLIEGQSLDGMQYTLAVKLPSREITLWVRQRRTDKARQSIEEAEASGEAVPDYALTPEDPHWLRLVREQAITLAWRIRAEVAVLQTWCDRLATLRPAAEQRASRAETATAVAHEVDAIGGDLNALHDALRVAFATALDAPRADSRALVALKALRDKLNAGVAAESGRRAGESLRRGGMRGRPPASLDAAITSALKADSATDVA